MGIKLREYAQRGDPNSPIRCDCVETVDGKGEISRPCEIRFKKDSWTTAELLTRLSNKFGEPVTFDSDPVTPE